MTKVSISAAVMLAAIAGNLLSCREYSDELLPNNAPVANAGPDRTVLLPKDSVVLDGTASYDEDGTITQYQWSKVKGPDTFVLANAGTSVATLESLVKGTYQVELAVKDNAGAWAKDTVYITVSAGPPGNQPPVAHAGTDQAITLPTNSCTLNGSNSTDPEGSITAYKWTKVAGPSSFSIQSPTDKQTLVTDLVAGTYQFELKVTDNDGLTDKDTGQVTVLAASVNCDVGERQQIVATATLIGTLSEARMPAVAAAGSKIVFAGGVSYSGSGYTTSSAVDIYDVNTRTWSTARLSREREGIAAVSCGNKIFFAGGGFFFLSFNNVDIYDVSTNKWTTARLSEPRAYLTAAAVGDKVLFAGGLTNGSWQPSSTVDIYDLSTDTWSKATLSEPKGDFGAVTVDNKVYFAGGSNGLGYSSRIDIYDNSKSTNQWSTASLLELKGGVSGVAAGNKIYWSGIAHPLNIGKVEVFNTTNNTSTTLNCLSYPRLSPGALVKNNDVVFFPNGTWRNDDLSTLSNQFDIYNLSTGQWTIGLLNQRVEAAGVINVNNTIYMGGGRVSLNGCTKNVYTISW